MCCQAGMSRQKWERKGKKGQTKKKREYSMQEQPANTHFPLLAKTAASVVDENACSIRACRTSGSFVCLFRSFERWRLFQQRGDATAATSLLPWWRRGLERVKVLHISFFFPLDETPWHWLPVPSLDLPDVWVVSVCVHAASFAFAFAFIFAIIMLALLFLFSGVCACRSFCHHSSVIFYRHRLLF